MSEADNTLPDEDGTDNADTAAASHVPIKPCPVCKVEIPDEICTFKNCEPCCMNRERPCTSTRMNKLQQSIKTNTTHEKSNNNNKGNKKSNKKSNNRTSNNKKSNNNNNRRETNEPTWTKGFQIQRRDA